MNNPTQADIDWFKRFLEDYKRLVRDHAKCKDELSKLDLQIEALYGVKAIRYDRVVVQGSPDPHVKERKRLQIIDRQIAWEEKRTKIERKLEIIEQFRQFPDPKISEAVFRIYCLKKDPDGERYTFDREARDLYVQSRTLQRWADAQIKKFLKNVVHDTFEP